MFLCLKYLKTKNLKCICSFTTDFLCDLSQNSRIEVPRVWYPNPCLASFQRCGVLTASIDDMELGTIDAKYILKEYNEVFNELGCIKYIIYYIAIYPRMVDHIKSH